MTGRRCSSIAATCPRRSATRPPGDRGARSSSQSRACYACPSRAEPSCVQTTPRPTAGSHGTCPRLRCPTVWTTWRLTFIDAERTIGDHDLPVAGLTVVAFPNSHLVYAFTWGALALMATLGAIFVN